MSQVLMFEVKKVFDEYPNDFDVTFRGWLRRNWKIYESFHNKGKQMMCQREHYSARTLVEVIRWHTDLQEADQLFKINNNVTPDMARMFNRITKTEFFREREKQHEPD
jgi:hypothetical protein